LLNRASTRSFSEVCERIFSVYGVNVYCILMLEDLLNSLLTKNLIKNNDYERIMDEINKDS
jgi:hypothetical protein